MAPYNNGSVHGQVTRIVANQSLTNNLLKINKTNLSLQYNLNDINVSSLTDGQVLSYNASSSKWMNSTLSAGSSSLSTLTDCTINTPIEGNLLVYSASASKWINADTIPDNILFVKDDKD